MVVILPTNNMNLNKKSQAGNNDYQILRRKWERILIGGDYDLSDVYVQKKIKVLSDSASKLYTAMSSKEEREAKPYLWEELQAPKTEEKKEKSSSSFIKISYYRLKEITLAYVSKGTSLYGREDVKNEVIAALDYIHTHWYNNEIKPYGNWWNWDIGSPLALNDIIVLMYDHLSEKQVKDNMESIQFHVPYITTSTGANRVWKAIIVALNGIISKDSERIEYGRDAINPVLPYVKKGDGFYRDGSFVQHDNYGYTGNYGEALITCLSKLVYLLDDSIWEINNKEIKNMYQWVEDSFEPLMYKGAFMDALRGRQISAYKFDDHVKGRVIIETIAFLSDFSPEPYKTKYQQMVKSWLRDEWYIDYYEYASILGVQHAQKIVKSHIKPRDPLVGCYQFAAMDRVLHRRPHFSYMIAMHSTRIKNYEQINSQNLRGWHTGDGMTYLYNNDLARFADAFWPTVDSHRLPGTTAIYGEEVKPKSVSDKDFAGGCQINGLFGVAGMELHPPESTLVAKKSWFLFDEEVVAVGSDINNIDPKNEVANEDQIETILDNYKLKQDGSNKIYIDGHEHSADSNQDISTQEVNWIHMEGNVVGSDIGFFIPGKQQISYVWQTRQDSYASIDKYDIVHDEMFTRNYFTLWKNHKEQPDYAYVVLPGITKEDMTQYAKSPQIDILENSSNVHAVRKAKAGLFGANFFTTSTVKIDKVTCKGPASIMLQEKEDRVDIAISDPTWKSVDTIIEIKGHFKGISNVHDNITSEIYEDHIKICMNMKDMMGQTRQLTLLREGA